MSNPTSPSIAAWFEPDQADLVASIARRLHASVVSVGSASAGSSGAAQSAFPDAAPAPDLRALLSSTDADVVLLASAGAFLAGERAGGGDADVLALAAASGRGTIVATLEPLPADLTLIAPLQAATRKATPVGASPATQVELAGLFRHTRSVREAHDALGELGRLRSVGIEALAPRTAGSLGARIYDALDVALSLLGEPEWVYAARPWAEFGVEGAAQSAPPAESLRELDGEMTIVLRYEDGRAASVFASSRGSEWSRRATLLGVNGQLSVTDAGFAWHNAEGERVDASPGPLWQSGGDEDDDRCAALVAESIARRLDASAPALPPSDQLRTLACAGAAMLSVRTGQPESPHTLRRMAGP